MWTAWISACCYIQEVPHSHCRASGVRPSQCIPALATPGFTRRAWPLLQGHLRYNTWVFDWAILAVELLIVERGISERAKPVHDT